MADKRLATQGITDDQEEWIKKESKRTGESIATVVRALIQEKVEADK